MQRASEKSNLVVIWERAGAKLGYGQKCSTVRGLPRDLPTAIGCERIGSLWPGPGVEQDAGWKRLDG